MELPQKIITHLKNREEVGLTLLYDHYSPALYGIAFRILGRKSFAEDALQQTFLKIWNDIDTYDADKASLFTWMYRIVRNTSIDIKRLKSFEKESKTETIDVSVHNLGASYVDSNSIDVDTVMDGLEDKYKFVIDHLYLKGYSQSELSDEYNIPLGTIKTRVRQAIKILRDKFGNESILVFILLCFTNVN